VRVLILAPYPHGEGPSQRFRYEQYLSYLEQNGVRCDEQSFWSMDAWRVLYKPGHTLDKLTGFASGWLRRFAVLFSLNRYDVVFIQREAAPVGPPVVEWLIAKVWRKKIIYDFDDAIWLPNASGVNKFAARLKWHGKVGTICKLSWKVSCGNDFLAAYARRFNTNVTVIPTTVDTQYHLQMESVGTFDKPVIGWTGSASTNQYLQMLDDVLFELRKRCDFEFLVISNQPPDMKFPHRFVKWSREREIEDLSEMSIGVMPLPDNEWSKGKCGFKLIQYLSIGIPAVASPVGVNNEIVINGETGLIAATKEEWVAALEQLVTDGSLRKRLCDNGRNHVERNYSVNSQKKRYLDLFA